VLLKRIEHQLLQLILFCASGFFPSSQDKFRATGTGRALPVPYSGAVPALACDYENPVNTGIPARNPPSVLRRGIRFPIFFAGRLYVNGQGGQFSRHTIEEGHRLSIIDKSQDGGCPDVPGWAGPDVTVRGDRRGWLRVQAETYAIG